MGRDRASQLNAAQSLGFVTRRFRADELCAHKIAFPPDQTAQTSDSLSSQQQYEGFRNGNRTNTNLSATFGNVHDEAFNPGAIRFKDNKSRTLDDNPSVLSITEVRPILHDEFYILSTQLPKL
jgi:hypothetical protein